MSPPSAASSPRAPDFPHIRAGHCGSGALRDLLEFRGLDYGSGPLSEGSVFGLAGGLGFLFVELPGIEPPIYLVGRGAELERDIAGHLGFGVEVRQTGDPDEGWAWVRDEIDNGRPPLVWADIAELEYLRVRMQNTRHDIVVVGYDEQAGVAWVADNDRDELQRCSLESLARARNSQGFPGPNRNTTFFYSWPERLKDPRDAVRDGIARTVENMESGGAMSADAATIWSPGTAGADGVDSFLRSYPNWRGAFGDQLPAALRSLGVFIVKAGTGGAMFRSLHATFLHDAADLLDDRQLGVLARTYDELAEAWRQLAETAAADDHQGGSEVVVAIGALEHTGVAQMRSWVRGRS